MTHHSVFELLVPAPRRAAWMLYAGALAGVAMLLWWSPVSPAALGRADARLGAGDAAGAALAYEKVAVHSPLAVVRQQALYRGALVYALDLDDPIRAQKLLRRLALMGEPARVASAWEVIGELELDQGNPRAAAAAYERAFEVLPSDPRAPIRLESSARAHAEAGEIGQASGALGRLAAGYPKRRGPALLALAELHLSDGNATEALAFYQDALVVVNEPDLAALARLGVVACLERLGDLDEALAVLDTGALPEESLEIRRRGLQQRSEHTGGLQ